MLLYHQLDGVSCGNIGFAVFKVKAIFESSKMAVCPISFEHVQSKLGMVVYHYPADELTFGKLVRWSIVRNVWVV